MPSNILFNNIPGSGLTAPIFSFEVNSGGQYQEIDRFILVGHVNSGAALPIGVPTPVADQNTVDSLCGAGSMLREMFRVAQQNAPATPFWILAVTDAGVAPVWSLTIGTLPGIGTGVFDVCGERMQVTLGAADTPTTIAAAIAAAINAYYDPLTGAMLPVTASPSAAVVTITARHKGAIMNEIDIFTPVRPSNLLSAAGVWTLVLTTTGSGNPSVAAPLAALGDDPADFIVCPWSDATSLAAYTALLSDVSGRWAWSRQSYGHVWTAQTGTFSALTTLGLSLNDRHSSIIGRIAGAAAAGTIALPTIPTANQTATINGTVVTFVASGATSLQVNIAGTAALTVTALLAMLSASTDAGLRGGTYSITGGTTLNVTAALTGRLGNAIGLATNVTAGVVSAATLSGGLDGSPHPSWYWAAGFAARVSPWLSDTTTGNVSRNQTGLVVQGVRPPRDRILWPNYASRNVLNNSGIGTFGVNPDGTLRIEKIVTSYLTGSAGQPDTVFRDVQALYQASGGLKQMRADLANEQSNKGIADTNPGDLGALTTPKDIAATLINSYTSLCLAGVFTDPKTFARLLNVRINAQNPARVDAFVPLARVNPLDILAANATIYQRFPQQLAA